MKLAKFLGEFILLTCFGELAISQVPVIYQFSPVSGLPGKSVVISGNNFSTDNSQNVVFFGTAAGYVIASTKTTIEAIPPLSSTYRPITVVSNGLAAQSQTPFILMSSPGGAINASSFAARTNFATGTNPIAIEVADVDNDGFLDVIVANLMSNSVSIYRNLGTTGLESFDVPFTLNTLPNPAFLATGDLDGDGKIDLVVGCTDPTNQICVFRNTSNPGNLSFVGRADYISGAFLTTIRIADLDQDGRLDIISCSGQDQALSIFRNTSATGTISLAKRVDISFTDMAPYWACVGDFDGDGKIDVACNIVTLTGFALSILRNTSSPSSISFATRIDYPLGDYPLALEAGDFDGDGRPDLAVTVNASKLVTIYQNQSTGSSLSFGAKTDLAIEKDPTWFTVSDFNGDGRPDIAVANQGDSSISVLMNMSSVGAPLFSPKVNFRTGKAPSSITAGDLNGDGKPEFVVVNRDDNSFSSFRNKIGDVSVPAAPSPLSPVDGALDQPVNIVLKWRGTQFASSYWLQVSNSSGFSPLTYSDSTLTDTTVSITGLTAATTYYWRVLARNSAGSSPWSLVYHLKTGSAASVEPALANAIPESFLLLQNYPNPFNPSTTIRYGLPHCSNVSLTFYNAIGQQVAALVKGEQAAGYHEVRFDGSGLASGVYFYRLQAADFVQTRKLLLLR